MLLREAKEILKKNGYRIHKLNECGGSFRSWYTSVADEIDMFGYDEVILSNAMEDDKMSMTVMKMYNDGVEPKQAAAEVIAWADSEK